MNFLQYFMRDFDPKFWSFIVLFSLLILIDKVVWVAVFIFCSIYIGMDYHFYKKEENMFRRYELQSKMMFEMHTQTMDNMLDRRDLS